MGRIDSLVEETPFLEPVQKEFYKVMIRERKKKILDCSMEQLLKQEEQAGMQERQASVQSM